MRFPLRLFPDNMSVDFISKRYYAFFFSLAITIGVFVLLIFKGMNLGIDFAGGIVLEMQCDKTVTVDELRAVLHNSQYHDFNLQDFHKNNVRRIMLRLRPVALQSPNTIINTADSERSSENIIRGVKTAISKHLESKHQAIEFTKIEYVGPKVGVEFVFNAMIAMLLALVIMMLYTWIRFDFIYGLGVIIALFHDAIATFGMYIITGYEFDLSSIAAILTVIGYSINDSVVIYDRIRENIAKYRNHTLGYIINLSINETFARSVMTLLTTLLVCVILALFGGDVLHGFSVAILFGITFGAYSSIYISAPILMLLHRDKQRSTITQTTKPTAIKKHTHQAY